MNQDHLEPEDRPLRRVLSRNVRWILIAIALLIIASSAVALISLGSAAGEDSTKGSARSWGVEDLPVERQVHRFTNWSRM